MLGFRSLLTWREQTGVSIRSYSPTGWWSQWEVIKQAMDFFGDIEPFLSSTDDFSPFTRSKLLAILYDTTKKSLLMVEMAAVVDSGERLVKATY